MLPIPGLFFGVFQPGRRFFNRLYFARTMTYESLIMLHILEEFVNAKKPILPIHDSVVCRKSDRDFAFQTMQKCYQHIMHFPPVIR
jgi:hypothetical protein